MASGWRSRLKRTFWPLLWVAGLAMIIYYAPPGYRSLQLEDREEIIGFRGPSHELITVTGGPSAAPKQQLAAAIPGLPMPPPHLWTKSLSV
jgi:hypothetical protein